MTYNFHFYAHTENYYKKKKKLNYLDYSWEETNTFCFVLQFKLELFFLAFMNR